MADAIADGQSKAEFLAGKAGATLGSVQSIAEGGGSIDCNSGEESCLRRIPGRTARLRLSGGGHLRGSPRPQAARVVRKPAVKHPKKQASAKKASATACTLSTQVSLVYAID